MVCIVHLKIIRLIKSNIVKWAKNIAKKGEYRSAFKIVIVKETFTKAWGDNTRICLK